MINLPVEFENRMKEMLKDDFEQFMASYDEKKKTGIRINTVKISKDDFLKVFPVNLSPVPWCDTGFVASGDEKYGRDALHDAGAFYMQEPSAMGPVAAIANIVDLKGKKILDLCAAPGGKSTELAAFMGNTGLLVSNEINKDRSSILSSNIERCGIRNCVVLNETPENIAERFEEFYDVVVVDAPCSGEGMFRKDETAIKEWSMENVAMCAKRQEDILKEAVKTVAPGGYLVYSTCTFAPAEDEEQIIKFLSDNPDFEVLSVPLFRFFDFGHKEWLSNGLSDEEDVLKKCARLWPHKIDGEGHFICVLHNTSLQGENEKGKKKKAEGSADRKTFSLIEAFVKDNLNGFEINKECAVCFKDSVYLLPEAFDKTLKGLKVVRAGINLGEIKKDRFEPSHSLAMVLSKEEAKRSIELDEDEALKFRHGEEIKKDCENGWTLVCFKGVSLGWCKATGGNLKNHYPKGLRIKY
ncbi:MAG: RsmF rRNA methyltransferase first C-terminal domain-containing protein [Lachnospiraceae bacterium]|nr:RsmF rRNA methyltransferase first C-terminal domain-containing protein [Lachnospiraceae bacterium]